MADLSKTVGSIRFGSYELALDCEELRKDGYRLRLTGQAIQVLVVLVNNPGKLVTREELQQKLWPGASYGDFEHGLNAAVNRLRETLGDSATDPKYVETIPRRGYRFIAPVNGRTNVASRIDAETEPAIGTGATVTAHNRGSRLKKYAVLAGALLAAAAGVVVGSRWQAPRLLDEGEMILVADFVNTTGDPIFDETMKQALVVDLGQSTHLNIFPDLKVRQTLQLMGHGSDERITREVGREISLRNGIRAILKGSIAKLGNRYVITLDAENASTGSSLATEEVQARTKEEVLDSLHRAASRLRRKLGESLTSLQKYDKPLSEVTTPSLEALKAFSLGEAKQKAGQMVAIALYQRAIDLDPNFAIAYARLGTMYGNTGQSELSEQNRKKAFELRDHASEREKLYIMSHYYADSGQLEEGIATYEVYKQTYPRDAAPYNNLSAIYIELGRFEYALEDSRKALELEPDSMSGYVVMSSAYAALDRLDEAKAAVNEGLKRSPDSKLMHAILAAIAREQNDPDTMENELKAAANGGAEGELNALELRAGLAADHGKVREARELTTRAAGNARRMGLKEAAADYETEEALWEATIGFKSQPRAAVHRALGESRSPNIALDAAVTLARLGDEDRALKLADDVAKQRPFDTIVQHVLIPEVKAVVEINRNRPAKAIDLLDGAMGYERANTRVLYGRGLAYLRDKRPAEAAQAFQRILDLKTLGYDSVSAIARLGLARAYAQQGDAPKARTAYKDFLTLWKDADPDISILKEAKAEYAKLQ
jgi:DNA-binding winged helix-turn-helix (wHTH) protein/predicted Zn-dependent protease